MQTIAPGQIGVVSSIHIGHIANGCYASRFHKWVRLAHATVWVAKNNVESRTTTGVEPHSLTLSRRLIALAEQFEDPIVQMEKLEDICGTVRGQTLIRCISTNSTSSSRTKPNALTSAPKGLMHTTTSQRCSECTCGRHTNLNASENPHSGPRREGESCTGQHFGRVKPYWLMYSKTRRRRRSTPIARGTGTMLHAVDACCLRRRRIH